jgi:hypothetical protein
MSNGNAMAKYEEPARLALEPKDWTEARSLAQIAVASRYFAVKSPEEALVILMTGRELGLSAMQSLRGIYVVQGRPVLSADLMVAAVVSSPRCEYWQPIESTAERCTIETKRRGAPAPVRKTWAAEDAKRAGLTGKDIWKSYPAQMLRHRCAADLAREVYPDLLMGVYVPGEIPGDEGPRREEVPPAPQRAAVSLVPQPRPSAQVTPEPGDAFEDPVAQMPDAEVVALESWRARIAQCATLANLNALLPEIKALPEALRRELRPVFEARREELRKPTPPTGGGSRPANDAGEARGEGAEGEAPADGSPQAYAAHLAKLGHPLAIANSVAKHAPNWGEEAGEYMRVAVKAAQAHGWSEATFRRKAAEAIARRESKGEAA